MEILKIIFRKKSEIFVKYVQVFEISLIKMDLSDKKKLDILNDWLIFKYFESL